MGTARTSPKVVRERRAKGIQPRRGKVKRHFPKNQRNDRALRHVASEAKGEKAIEGAISEAAIETTLRPLVTDDGHDLFQKPESRPVPAELALPSVESRMASRFWGKVYRQPEMDGCWLWRGKIDPSGYGKFTYGKGFGKAVRQVNAHRMAWQLTYGEEPAFPLAHICQNSSCVRPDHLKLRFNDKPWVPVEMEPVVMSETEVSEFAIRTAEAEMDLMPLLLYRGNMSLGRAQALLNWTLVGDKLGIGKTRELSNITKVSPDLAHLVGLHSPVEPVSFERFWARMVDNPRTLTLRPGLIDYVHSVEAGHVGIMYSRLHPSLGRIEQYSRWSTRKWRQPPSRNLPDVPEVWPFVADGATDPTGHELVQSVDAVVPKFMPEQIRQEVCQDLLLAVLDGELRVTELKDHAEVYVKKVFAQFPIKYGHLSLDQPPPWQHNDSHATLGDLLVASGWNPEGRWIGDRADDEAA